MNKLVLGPKIGGWIHRERRASDLSVVSDPPMATFVEIRDGVRLETRRYGDPTSSRALVVWGHGLCNSMAGEDEDMLWNFWHDDGAVASGLLVCNIVSRSRPNNTCKA